MKSKLVPVRAAVAVALIAALATVLGPATASQAAGAAPVITSVNPNHGPTTGGTQVTIGGLNFIGVDQVLFENAPAAFTIVSDTEIMAVSPVHNPGPVDINLKGINGPSTNSTADRFTYELPPPSVTAVNPSQGPQTGGTSVTILGNNFTGAKTLNCSPNPCGLFFGSIAVPAANYTVDITGTRITATSPFSPTAGTVDIRVTTPGGTSATSSNDHFTYIDRPTVTSVSPSGGSSAGGTSVTITGTNFNSVSAVDFGGTAATGVTTNSSTSITATSPAHAAGTVDVTVTAAGGTSATNVGDHYQYVDGPVVSGINPNSGPSTATTPVTITGARFCASNGATPAGCAGGGFTTTAVNFGATPAVSFTVVSPTQINAVAPTHSAGTVNVHVTTNDTGNPTNTDVAPNNDAFSYTGTDPFVTGVSPSAGPTTGGTSIVVSGVNFGGATGVSFVGASTICVTSFTVNPAGTQITLATPADSAGTVDVKVTVGPLSSGCTGGTTSPTNSPYDHFTFVSPPSISTVSPNHGPANSPTTVTISGSNLANPVSVDFGPNPATSFSYNSGPGTITATTDGGVDTVDVRVTTQDGGQSDIALGDKFTYGPVVTGIDPNQGPTAGGIHVIISGYGFKPSGAGTPTVDFGTTGATVNTSTDTSLDVMVPAQGAEPSSVHVTVTQGGETSPATAADVFEWVPKPTVTGVSPASGSTQGGDTVTITGTNFDFTSEVDFGSGNAAQIVSTTTNQLTVVSPSAPAAGFVDVQVITPGGTSVPNPPNDQYQYFQVSTVTSVTPSSGPRTGGTMVTLTGTGFSQSPNPTVDFGATPATAVNVVDDSHITAVSPAGSVGTVDVTVSNIGGTSPTSPADQFTYTPAPVSASGAFPIGIVGGYPAENVTIFGSGFQPGATVTSNNPGISITVDSVSPNQISTTMSTRSASASAASVGPSTLIVHNPDGGTANIGNFLVYASGYYTTTQAGTVNNFGSIPFAGDLTGIPLNKPIVGMAATPDGNGYWLVASDGGIFSFGDAGFFGSEGGVHLNKPIVGMAATPTGKGYWLVASDGGIFTHGDAGFFGSEGGIKLNKPVVGMAPTRSGQGYWLVATDGGIFTHGDAAFFGSEGSVPLNKPVVGMEPTGSGHGYWLVASDGGVFTHGDAPFVGSLGSVKLNAPIVGMAPGLTGTGYYLLGGDGGVFTFNVPFYGSQPTGGAGAAIADVARIR